jgi:hypothetical protein
MDSLLLWTFAGLWRDHSKLIVIVVVGGVILIQAIPGYLAWKKAKEETEYKRDRYKDCAVAACEEIDYIVKNLSFGRKIYNMMQDVRREYGNLETGRDGSYWTGGLTALFVGMTATSKEISDERYDVSWTFIVTAVISLVIVRYLFGKRVATGERYSNTPENLQLWLVMEKAKSDSYSLANISREDYDLVQQIKDLQVKIDEYYNYGNPSRIGTVYIVNLAHWLTRNCERNNWEKDEDDDDDEE